MPAAALLATLAIAGCGQPPLDDAKRRELYARRDATFRSAFLWKPAGDDIGGLLFDLAPLLLQEADTSDPAAAPLVELTESTAEIRGVRCRQLTYSWRHPSFTQGVRMTLGADGFPAIYEVLNDSSGARLFFVSSPVEEAASAEFGSPLPGRSFAVERATTDAPGVVVVETLEPGPLPLGPFVYLSASEHDVTSLICRCSSSRVETVLGAAEYHLATSGEGMTVRGDGLEAVLRLPSAFGCS